MGLRMCKYDYVEEPGWSSLFFFFFLFFFSFFLGGAWGWVACTLGAVLGDGMGQDSGGGYFPFS